jgi:hypothetical protein
VNDKANALIRALAEPGLLRTLAELSGEAVSVAELCGRLSLEPDLIGGHLQLIGSTGILATERVGRDRLYRIDVDRIRQLGEPLDAPTEQSAGRKPPAEIAQFFRGERLERMPAQHAKQVIVLTFLIDDFEFAREYPEVEVNSVIAHRNADFATIRRAFIDEGFMTRSANMYRRTNRSIVG